MPGECAVDFCDRQSYARGWCRAHYNQWYVGNPFTPIKRKRSVVDGKKECAVCEKTKPVTDYYGASSGGIQSACKVCQVETNRERVRSKVAARQAREEKGLGKPSSTNKGQSTQTIKETAE